jgi:hypothetical protein
MPWQTAADKDGRMTHEKPEFESDEAHRIVLNNAGTANGNSSPTATVARKAVMKLRQRKEK